MADADPAAVLGEIKDRNLDAYADDSDSDLPRLLAAVEAVLKLADDLEELPYRDMAQVDAADMIREAITRELTGKEPDHGRG